MKTVFVEILDDGRYRLTAPFVYPGRDQTFTVPAGFVTDLASVPRALSALVPIAGRHDRAAIVHDFLCTALDGGTPIVDAVDTDGIFRRILRELGVPLVLRWLFWTGVRWGALANPARRRGWLRTAPAVLAISALVLPFVLPVFVVTGLALLIGGAVEAAT